MNAPTFLNGHCDYLDAKLSHVSSLLWLLQKAAGGEIDGDQKPCDADLVRCIDQVEHILIVARDYVLDLPDGALVAQAALLIDLERMASIALLMRSVTQSNDAQGTGNRHAFQGNQTWSDLFEVLDDQVEQARAWLFSTKVPTDAEKGAPSTSAPKSKKTTGRRESEVPA